MSLSLDLQVGLQFQKWISEINDDNETETINNIITAFISFYCKKDLQDNLNFLVSEIGFAAEHQPKSIRNLSHLVKEITTTRKTDKFNSFRQVLIDAFMSMVRIYSFEMRMRLLKQCFHDGIFTLDEIREYISVFPMEPSTRLFILLAIFCHELDKQDNNFITEIFNKFEVWFTSSQQIEQNSSIDIEFLRNTLTSFRGNEGKFAEELISNFYPVESVEYAIFNDDIGNTQQLLPDSQVISNIFLKKSYFNPNSEILTPLQFAAQCGSFNCFKYLFELSEEKDRLPVFAVEGGNLEIVKICDASQLDFADVLAIASLNRKTEVLDWLLKNKEFGRAEAEQALGICLMTKSIAALQVFLQNDKQIPKR